MRTAKILITLRFHVDWSESSLVSHFGGRIFKQTIGILMGTNCAPLLADLFLYSYEAEFVQSLLKTGKKHLAQQFNFTYRYIDDVLSLHEKHKICRVFEIHLSRLTWNKGNNGDCSLLLILGLLSLHWQYDKRDDFNFLIVNFPFLNSNIPSAPAYGVYVSQLIH